MWLSEGRSRKPREGGVERSFKRKNARWKEVLGAIDKDAKKRCLAALKEERERLKGVCIRAKRKVSCIVILNFLLFWDFPRLIHS